MKTKFKTGDIVTPKLGYWDIVRAEHPNNSYPPDYTRLVVSHVEYSENTTEEDEVKLRFNRDLKYSIPLTSEGFTLVDRGSIAKVGDVVTAIGEFWDRLAEVKYLDRDALPVDSKDYTIKEVYPGYYELRDMFGRWSKEGFITNMDDIFDRLIKKYERGI